PGSYGLSGWWIYPLKFEPESAAFAGLRFDADCAVHALGGFADEGEADAGAFVALVELLEHAENALLIFGGDADPVIFEPEADEAAVRFRRDAHVRDFPRLNEFDGVGQEV